MYANMIKPYILKKMTVCLHIVFEQNNALLYFGICPDLISELILFPSLNLGNASLITVFWTIICWVTCKFLLDMT